MALLIQGQLFTQKEILCRQNSARAQSKPQYMRGIDEKHAQRGHELYEGMK
jgi:hypothetical protein